MKLIREYINEKFSEESDPVHDMGIGVQGVIDEIKKRLKRAGYPNAHDHQIFRECFINVEWEKALLVMNYMLKNNKVQIAKEDADYAWNIWEYNQRANIDENKMLLDFIVEKSIETNAKKALDMFLLNYSKNNKTDMIIKLLKAGANPLMRGSKPIMLAVKFKNKKVFDLMQPHIKWK